MKIDKLEVVLKVTEVCNIDCTYCYFFSERNEDFKSKPLYIEQSTIDAAAKFLKETCLKHQIDFLQIDIHGGEPLMVGKKSMRDLLETFSATFSGVSELQYSMQTNGMLLDDEWIEILGPPGVQVSISVDGPERINDRERVDKRGRGTYAKTIKGLRLLQGALDRYPRLLGGVIAVVRPQTSGAQIYRHLADELGFSRIHFSLPDHTRDSASSENIGENTEFLMSALDQWLGDGPRGIDVRIFRRMVAGIVLPKEELTRNRIYRVITIRSDGAIDPDDNLRNAVPHLFGLGYTVFQSAYEEFALDERISGMYQQINTVAPHCRKCEFVGPCQSGNLFAQPEHRFSFVAKFNNASAYCDAYKKGFNKVIAWCESEGMSRRVIEKNIRQSAIDSVES